MLVLASKSPRRRDLLTAMGLSYTILEADIDETSPADASPEDAAVAVARRKAEAVRYLCTPDDIIIAADTTVVLPDTPPVVLGKPHDPADARRMLRLLSGRTHTVLTGMAVLRGDVTLTRCVATKVTFRNLTEREIEGYLATGEPLDKAGAYGVQGRAAWLVEHIDGDYFNVVGLPLAPLGELLREVGYEVWKTRED